MKSTILSLLLLGTGAVTLTPASVHAQEIINQRVIRLNINDATINNNAPIEIALGDVLEVELENNGSIGTTWRPFNSSQDEVLSLNTPESGIVKTPQQTDHLIGSPTVYCWRFNPKAVGKTSIHFIQIFRGQKSQTIDFNIVVSPEKTDL